MSSHKSTVFAWIPAAAMVLLTACGLSACAQSGGGSAGNGAASLTGSGKSNTGRTGLPFSTVFKGVERFQPLLAKARAEGWQTLPINERVTRFGLALCGTPYVGYTLEIDDHVEAASVNLNGLDCWTFFETSLAFARLIRLPESEQTPENLLRLIELDRYRNGVCDGNYLSRLHFLEDWIHDNEKRGLVRNITQELGGQRMAPRQIAEMSHAWKGYRYLRCNRSLLPRMAQVEDRVSSLPVWYIPKRNVAQIEPQLQSGDIICITANDPGSYTSHVGLVYRDERGVVHFMHACSTYAKGRKVLVDERLSDYLAGNGSQSGIYVARPCELPVTVAPAPPTVASSPVPAAVPSPAENAAAPAVAPVGAPAPVPARQ